MMINTKHGFAYINLKCKKFWVSTTLFSGYSFGYLNGEWRFNNWKKQYEKEYGYI
jgi:hypothetical protein